MFYLFVVVFVGAAVFLQPGSPIKVELTSQQQKDVIPNTLNIRCSLGKMDYDAFRITTIKLFKDTDLVAQIYAGNKKFEGLDYENSITIEGHRGFEWNESFLSVTFKEAKKELSGPYRCVVDYLSWANIHHKEESTKKVPVKDLDWKDVVGSLLQKVSDLEQTVENQRGIIAQQNTSLQTQNKKLRNLELEMSVQADNFNNSLGYYANDITNRLDNSTRMFEDKIVEQSQQFSTQDDEVKRELENKINQKAKGERLRTNNRLRNMMCCPRD